MASVRTTPQEQAGSFRTRRGGNKPRLIGLIVGFDPRPNIGAPVGFIAPASAFAPYLNGAVISRVDRPSQIPEMSMN